MFCCPTIPQDCSQDSFLTALEVDRHHCCQVNSPAPTLQLVLTIGQSFPHPSDFRSCNSTWPETFERAPRRHRRATQQHSRQVVTHVTSPPLRTSASRHPTQQRVRLPALTRVQLNGLFFFARRMSQGSPPRNRNLSYDGPVTTQIIHLLSPRREVNQSFDQMSRNKPRVTSIMTVNGLKIPVGIRDPIWNQKDSWDDPLRNTELRHLIFRTLLMLFKFIGIIRQSLTCQRKITMSNPLSICFIVCVKETTAISSTIRYDIRSCSSFNFKDTKKMFNTPNVIQDDPSITEFKKTKMCCKDT